MLTLNQIRGLKTINAEVAREAYVQVEKRLADVLDARKTVEQKATSLFSAYLTIALALFGVGGALLKGPVSDVLPFPFFVAGAIVVVGALMFIWAIWPMRYGYVGTAASFWLEEEKIDSGPDGLPVMLLYLAQYQDERINVSLTSNRWKFLALRLGMGCGVLAAFALVAAFIVPWVWAYSSHP